MGKKLRIEITDAELAILEKLWEHGEQTVGSIAEKLYPSGTTAEYATVQTLLLRLEKKGGIVRDRSARAHVFRASVERGDLIGSHLQNMADKLCGGSLVPVVTHLVKGASLKANERKALRKLLEDLES